MVKQGDPKENLEKTPVLLNQEETKLKLLKDLLAL